MDHQSTLGTRQEQILGPSVDGFYGLTCDALGNAFFYRPAKAGFSNLHPADFSANYMRLYAATGGFNFG
jgi:hypothetical protein